MNGGIERRGKEKTPAETQRSGATEKSKASVYSSVTKSAKKEPQARQASSRAVVSQSPGWRSGVGKLLSRFTRIKSHGQS